MNREPCLGGLVNARLLKHYLFWIVLISLYMQFNFLQVWSRRSLEFGAWSVGHGASLIFCPFYYSVISLSYLSCQHLLMHFSLSFWLYWPIWLGTWSTVFLTPPRSCHPQIRPMLESVFTYFHQWSKLLFYIILVSHVEIFIIPPRSSCKNLLIDCSPSQNPTLPQKINICWPTFVCPTEHTFILKAHFIMYCVSQVYMKFGYSRSH